MKRQEAEKDSLLRQQITSALSGARDFAASLTQDAKDQFLRATIRRTVVNGPDAESPESGPAGVVSEPEIENRRYLLNVEFSESSITSMLSKHCAEGSIELNGWLRTLDGDPKKLRQPARRIIAHTKENPSHLYRPLGRRSKCVGLRRSITLIQLASLASISLRGGICCPGKSLLHSLRATAISAARRLFPRSSVRGPVEVARPSQNEVSMGISSRDPPPAGWLELG